MRLTKRETLERHKRIAAYCYQNPTVGKAAIGRVFGVSPCSIDIAKRRFPKEDVKEEIAWDPNELDGVFNPKHDFRNLIIYIDNE